jgi:predicted kinase
MCLYINVLQQIESFKKEPDPITKILVAMKQPFVPPQPFVEGKQFVMLVGVPGSGKSTIARNHFKDYAYHSTDNKLEEIARLKYNIENDYCDAFRTLSKNGDDWVAKTIEDAMLSLEQKNVVYDATNLTKKRNNVIKLAREKGATVTLFFVWRDLNTCIKARKNPDKYIPTEVILNMANSFVYPTKDEYDNIMHKII